MLGAAPIADVIDHSDGVRRRPPGVTGTVVDLGSGGGVPGLVIAWRRPDLRLVLVDRRATRTDHLRRLVTRLGLGERVSVLTAEARALPRLLDRPVAAVVARGFGKPRGVIGAALPILEVGGWSSSASRRVGPTGGPTRRQRLRAGGERPPSRRAAACSTGNIADGRHVSNARLDVST